MLLCSACGALLPVSESETQSPWTSFAQAQANFDRIKEHETNSAQLRELHFDPVANPNVAILSYADVLRRFIPAPGADTGALDGGLRECLNATLHCRGYEVDHKVIHRKRYGNFWADLFNFRRKVDVVGWRFNAVVLVVDDVVVYKLSGGQPTIHEHEESVNPLGPLQGAGESVLRPH